jgi:hypothetical protein
MEAPAAIASDRPWPDDPKKGRGAAPRVGVCKVVLVRGLAVGVFLILLGASSAPAAAETCLDWHPAPVSLSGRILVMQGWGPPNFGEDPEHDAHLSWYQLIAFDVVCVDSGDPQVPGEDGLRAVRDFQLLYRGTIPPELLGRAVVVSGTLIAGVTAYYHTPASIGVTRIAPLRTEQLPFTKALEIR